MSCSTSVLLVATRYYFLVLLIFRNHDPCVRIVVVIKLGKVRTKSPFLSVETYYQLKSLLVVTERIRSFAVNFHEMIVGIFPRQHSTQKF